MDIHTVFNQYHNYIQCHRLKLELYIYDIYCLSYSIKWSQRSVHLVRNNPYTPMIPVCINMIYTFFFNFIYIFFGGC